MPLCFCEGQGTDKKKKNKSEIKTNQTKSFKGAKLNKNE